MPLFQTADLVDEFGEQCISCSTQFRSFGSKAEFSGRVRTVKCYDDNVLLRQLLAKPSNGEIVVVDGAGFLGSALMGDQIAALAVNSGWAGVIIFGAVRDASALTTMPLGVKALGTNPRKSRKDGVGWVDIPIRFGDAEFRPGLWLYSDVDGIVVSEHPLRGETQIC